MSEGNGVFKVWEKVGTGTWSVQFMEDEPAIEVDVVETYNDYIDMIDKFRDEKGEIDSKRSSELQKAKWGWAQQLVLTHLDMTDEEKTSALRINANMSEAHALHFCKGLIDKAQALLPFFRPESATASSSQGSSPTVAYSQ